MRIVLVLTLHADVVCDVAGDALLTLKLLLLSVVCISDSFSDPLSSALNELWKVRLLARLQRSVVMHLCLWKQYLLVGASQVLTRVLARTPLSISAQASDYVLSCRSGTCHASV